jgi:hypothetical protein
MIDHAYNPYNSKSSYILPQMALGKIWRTYLQNKAKWLEAWLKNGRALALHKVLSSYPYHQKKISKNKFLKLKFSLKMSQQRSKSQNGQYEEKVK